KSTFNRHLALSLWKAYSLQDPPTLVPLFISLAALEDPSQNLIRKYLKNECGFSLAQIKDFQKNQKFIFILDGYDEIPQHPRFYEDNEFAKWDAKTIITSRPEYLRPGCQSKFQARDSHNRYFQEMWIAPFSEVKIHEYIRNYVVESHKRGQN